MTAKIRGRAVPSLLVRDMAATLSFYQKLGFRLTGRPQDGELLIWCEVRHGEAILQFFTEAPLGVPNQPCLSGTLYFSVENVSALAAAWRDAVDFAWGPEQMPYGQYEFGIEDPNGYFLAFAEAAKHEP